MKGSRLTSCILFAGIAISFFAFLNGVNLYQRFQDALKEVNHYEYRSSYQVQIADASHADAIMETIAKCPGIIFLDDNLAYYDDFQIYHGETVQVVVQNEPMNYPVQDGVIPSQIPAKRQAAVGNNLQSYVSRDGDKAYITVNGEQYDIAAQLGGDQADMFCSVAVIWDPDSISNCKKMLQMDGKLVFKAVSDQCDLSEYMQTLQTQIDGYGEDSSMVCQPGMVGQIDIDRSTDQDFYWLIGLFSVINCVIVSEFWILRRKQEMVIRKIWGYGTWHLIGLLYREMLRIAMCAVVVVWLIQWILSKTMGAEQGIIMDMGKLAGSILFVVMISLVIILLPVYKMTREMPCEGLEV